MNKILRYILALLALATILQAVAYDFSAVNEQGFTIYYNRLNQSEVEVTHSAPDGTPVGEIHCSYPSSSYVIPSLVVDSDNNTYTVTTIGSWAFTKCQSILSLSLPETVIELKDYAFDDCQSLQNIDISNITIISGSSIFQGCTSLTEITLPPHVQAINIYAFYAGHLEIINIPAEFDFVFVPVYNDDYSVFNSGYSTNYFSSPYLRQFNVSPENPLYFSDGLTLYSKDKTKVYSTVNRFSGELIIDEGVEVIESHAIYFTFFTSIKLPNSLKEIGDGGLSANYNLLNVEIPFNANTLGYSCISRNRNASIILRPPYLTETSEINEGKEASKFYVNEESTAYYRSFSGNPTMVRAGFYYGKKRPGYWGTVCVGHNVNLPSYHTDGMTFYTLSGYTTSGDMLTGISVEPVENNLLENGKPYFFYYDGSETDHIDYPDAAEGVELFGLDYVDPENDTATSELTTNRGFHGCLGAEGQEFAYDDNVYMLKDNRLYRARVADENDTDRSPIGTSSYCGKNKCYISLPELISSTPANPTPSAKARFIPIVDETSGIEGIRLDEIPAADAPMYDLLGRPVTNPGRGIYIQAGRKVVR